MFNHIMVGSNDIERSEQFYNAVLAVLGAIAALVWRRLQQGAGEARADHVPAEAGPAPDAFGTAFDRAEPVVAARP